jgi:DNA-damage-inducible protein J
MAKTATLNLRVNPEVKSDAEGVLEQLGIPMSTAINMYLRQIVLTGGIPFTPKLPSAPSSVNVDGMGDEELRSLLFDRLSEATSRPGTPLADARAELLA